MNRRLPLCFTLFLLSARADPIPTITITSATGESSWTAGGSSTSLAGPDFTLNFGALYPSNEGGEAAIYFHILAGVTFTPGFELSAFQGSSVVLPEGTLALNGSTYAIVYQSTYRIDALASTTAPSGFATIGLPAALTGTGTVCEPPLSTCGSTINPTLAEVDFDVSGIMTLSFSPAPANDPFINYGNEIYSATFTPVPEPSAILLIIAGLGLVAGAGRRANARP